MRRAVLVLALLAALPQGALAEKTSPIIPILISPSEDSARISVTVDAGLRSSKPLATEALREARAAMHAGQTIGIADLRALAEAGDGLAAQRYVRVLLADRASAKPSDIAYFAAIAVGSGRIWTLEPMIEAMHRLDPDTEEVGRIREYIKVLYPHAWAGNTLALDALVAFNGEGRLFGPLSDATRDRILAEAREQGDGRTELSLAMGILEMQHANGFPDAEALKQARAYLELAIGSDHLGVRTTAQNLLRMMENG